MLNIKTILSPVGWFIRRTSPEWVSPLSGTTRASYSMAKFGPALNSEFRPENIHRFLPTQPILRLYDEGKKEKNN